MMLYPLKFKPLYKERVWGGGNFKTLAARTQPNQMIVGESWELSSLEGDEPEVLEGRLEENEISELIEVFMGELVGDSVYEKFGIGLPIIIKLIDTEHSTSIQVCPDDQLAKERYGSMGATKMWYVIDAKPSSFIGLGFKTDITQHDYLAALEQGTVDDTINVVEVFKGDSFMIPAGTPHYIGGGVVLAEVQQASDIAFRIYDWERDEQELERDLHVDLAAEALYFDEPSTRLCITKPAMVGSPVNLVNSEHFVVQLLKIEDSMLRDFFTLDSFVAYVCVEGSAMLGDTSIEAGETVMVPALIERLEIKGNATLLEIFMNIETE